MFNSTWSESKSETVTMETLWTDIQVNNEVSTIEYEYLFKTASLVAQVVKNSPAIQETQGRSLDQEDPLEKGMATQSNILAWRILWTEKWPGGLQSVGSQKVGHYWATKHACNNYNFSFTHR